MKIGIHLGIEQVLLSGSAEDPYFSGLADFADDHLARFFLRYLPGNGVAVDVGANIGLTSILLSQAAPNGRIVSIEPGRRNFEYLRENLRQNSSGQTTALEVALSSQSGKFRFQESTAYGGLTIGERDDVDSYEVQVSTLDTVVRDLGLTRLDLVKVDVEGTERSVLDGGREVIERFDPIMVMEFNAWTLLAYGNDNPKSLLRDLVNEFAYVGVLEPDGMPRRLHQDNWLSFLHDHINTVRNAEDLVIRHRGPIKEIGADLTGRNLDSLVAATRFAVADRDKAVAERDRALAERDEVAAELDSLRTSRSWRLTRPLRSARRLARRKDAGEGGAAHC